MSAASAQLSGSFLSLKISIINAIAELGLRAEAAERDGDEMQRAALSHESVRLAMEATTLRRAELAAKNTELNDLLDEMKSIAAEAKKASACIDRTADTFTHVEELITLIGRTAFRCS
ncbi:hypothetical protein SAMN06273572_102588 [Monaibacterium marinum]|uniref:Uncharacterized protein n=1 Tax=Pontivivens marinum TaxID=1690039 RepID=A0A2C9CU42_9RHOB|nr:hypothetical protein [Monaibacterium marinum]SOH93909.1 hypothetical protein SAMN06273572_102588 [Monaibacterium marinum]